MKKLNIKLENCYGIKNIDVQIDFSKKRAAIIYAPNGTMKSSFAETFKDLSDGRPSKDRVYTSRQTSRIITDENQQEIPSESVFVIKPLVPDYVSSNISTLLVNNALKEEYENISAKIEGKKDELLNELAKLSGLKKLAVEDAVSILFNKEKGKFLVAMGRLKDEIMDEANSELSGIKYSAIFNDKVENFLATKDFKDKLFEYTTIYDNLVSNSTFFRKGVFNHYQASEIAKSLNSHGFFKAEHSIYLNPNNEKREVKTEAELLELIQNEKNAILKNHKLSSAFSELDEKLKANSELRDFREFLLNHQELLPEFSNPELLKEKLWKSYLIKQKEHFMSLMEVYNEGKYRLQSITDKASQEATQWQEVINIFNRRFSVPFVVGIENKQDVILRRVTPNLHFQYVDGSELIPVERSLLTDVLSNGEKRALYILNIIFEVEARKLSRTKTLFVIDDIADSFDYKNKYAIIEYLNDILHEENFRQIILTHNFDFYRTVSTRLELSGNNFHICKAHNNLSLEADTMYKDRFKLWKDNVCKGENKKMLIALIPFARNIAEHCGLSNEVNQLTALLHVKENTDSFTVIDLEEIFKKVFNGSISNLVDRQQNVKQMIYDEAKKILNDDTYKLDLENKIALSIAIRLKSEDFMIKKIDDINVVSNIRSNQTATLIKKYKEKYGGFKLLTQKRNNFKKVF